MKRGHRRHRSQRTPHRQACYIRNTNYVVSSGITACSVDAGSGACAPTSGQDRDERRVHTYLLDPCLRQCQGVPPCSPRKGTSLSRCMSDSQDQSPWPAWAATEKESPCETAWKGPSVFFSGSSLARLLLKTAKKVVIFNDSPNRIDAHFSLRSCHQACPCQMSHSCSLMSPTSDCSS